MRNFDPASATPEFTPNIPAQQATIQQASAAPQFTPNNPAQLRDDPTGQRHTRVHAERSQRPHGERNGFLGKPRGSRVIIDGIMVNAMLRNPLAVSAIDGVGYLLIG